MLSVRKQLHSFSTHERMFLWKCLSFWDRKCLDLRGARTPQPSDHAECSDHLSYHTQNDFNFVYHFSIVNKWKRRCMYTFMYISFQELWQWHDCPGVSKITAVSQIPRSMGPTWGRQDPGGPHVDPMNLAIRGDIHKTAWYQTVMEHMVHILCIILASNMRYLIKFILSEHLNYTRAMLYPSHDSYVIWGSWRINYRESDCLFKIFKVQYYWPFCDENPLLTNGFLSQRKSDPESAPISRRHREYSGVTSCKHDDVIKWKHFRVTGHLCGEFTGPRWIPHKKATDAELWCFLWSAPE